MTTEIDGDLQTAIDDAEPGATLVGDPGIVHELTEPLVISTPGLTVRDISVRLKAEVNADVVNINADRVTLRDVAVDGNRDAQVGDRPSSGVLVTNAEGVRLEGLYVDDATRHGIRVFGAGEFDFEHRPNEAGIDAITAGPVRSMTIRDAEIRNPRRDGCSIHGTDIADVLVDGVRTYESDDKGCTEVKDGARDVLVTGCFARGCEYAVTVQDHGHRGTRNVLVTANRAENCAKLVTTQGEVRHENVGFVGNVGRDLTDNDVWQTGPGGIYGGLVDGLRIGDNVIDGVGGPGIVIEGATDACVSDNVVRNVEGDGIRVEGDESDGYLVTDNLARGSGVADEGGGEGVISTNMS